MKAFVVSFQDDTRINLWDWKKDYKKNDKLVLERERAMFACKHGWAKLLWEVEIEYKDIQEKMKPSKKKDDIVKELKDQATSLGIDWKDFNKLKEEEMQKAIKEAKELQKTLIEEATTLWLEIDDSKSIPDIKKAIKEAKAVAAKK